MRGSNKDSGIVSHRHNVIGFVTRIVASVAICTLLVGGCASAGDPFRTESQTTASPGQRWTGEPPALTAVRGKAEKLPTGALSLAALTDYALSHNPASREIWAAARAQAAAYGVAQAAFLPSLDVTVSATHGRFSSNAGSGFSNFQTSSNGTTQTRIVPSLGLSYVLFDFGARAATAEAAQYNLLAANLAQNRALQDIVLQVEQAYYQLLGANELIAATQQTIRNAEASYEAADARREAGLATIGEVYQARTVLAQARLALDRARGDARKFSGQLATAVGLPVNTQLMLAPVPPKPPTADIKQTVDMYLTQAQAARPDLAAAEAQARAAQARIKLAEASGKPIIGVSASSGLSYVSGNDAVGRTSSIGLNVQIPVFTGFRSTYATKQAEALADQAAAARDRLLQQVDLDVWQAYFDLETASAAIQSAEVFYASAQQSLEVAQARYKAGVGTLLDVLSAQAADATARVDAIQAQLAWYSALSRLNNAMGAVVAPGQTQS